MLVSFPKNCSRVSGSKNDRQSANETRKCLHGRIPLKIAIASLATCTVNYFEDTETGKVEIEKRKALTCPEDVASAEKLP